LQQYRRKAEIMQKMHEVAQVTRSAAPHPVDSLRASASDADTAESVMRRVYDDLTVQIPQQGSLDLALTSFDLESIKVANLTISEASVTTEPYPYYTVVTNVEGQMRTSVGGRSTVVRSREMAVSSPGQPVRVDYLGPTTRIDTIVIERQALEDELSAITGQSITGPIDFRFDAVSAAPDNPFQLALTTVRQDLAQVSGLASHPALRGHLTGMLMSGLLLGHPHGWTERIFMPAPASGTNAIRRVVAAVDNDPMAYATVTDLARVANLSVRALEDGFRRYLGCPPMRYVRSVRLRRAHEDLVASYFDQVTATAIAQRWGFGHYGRFVAEYRARYGATPAATLRG
jgi:AraC-like DNA-binding protein